MSNSDTTNIYPMDQITVKSFSGETGTVRITGEVFFPGVYPISSYETLANVISRAGGLKINASPQSAIFQRDSLKRLEYDRLIKLQQEAKRNILLSQQSFGQDRDTTLDLAILDGILEKEVDLEDLGRLVIDLEAILEGQSDKVIVLEDGDTLIIPKQRNVVAVIGEVYVPNSHVFQQNVSKDDYIRLSGGVTDYADPDNAYIIKSDGSIASVSGNRGFFRSGSRSNIEPGDTIVVPMQLGSPFSALEATTDITQILYQMSIAAAAVNSF